MDIWKRHKYVEQRLAELFPIPNESEYGYEGSGYYLEIIEKGLAKWNAIDPDEDEFCPAECQVMEAIKAVVDVWHERDRKEYEYDQNENEEEIL